MATTSFLYHTLGLRGYQHLRTDYRGGAVFHHVELRFDRRTCRGCGAKFDELTLEGRFERTFRALPVGSRRQFVVLHGHEQLCRRCGSKLREPIAFAVGKRRHIKVFERFIVDLCRIAPIKHVALLLGFSWTSVKEIFKGHLRRRLVKRSLKSVRLIAIDEFSIRKGHQYMTVVLDLESGEILHSAEGRSAESVIPFLRKLKAVEAPLKAVAMDMWPAYLLAVRDVFPEVEIVHDPYHVVSMANTAIDTARRDMYRKLRGAERKVMKGSRFLLLRGGESLDHDALLHLQRLESLNQPLFQAYLLKEDLRRFWSMPSRKAARKFLGAWIARCLATRIKPMVSLAKSLRAHRRGLLAYFQYPISTGPLEGMNNKIKVLKRQAYGFRDIDYFKLRLAFLHEATPAFPG
jgi:transposase